MNEANKLLHDYRGTLAGRIARQAVNATWKAMSGCCCHKKYLLSVGICTYSQTGNGKCTRRSCPVMRKGVGK